MKFNSLRLHLVLMYFQLRYLPNYSLAEELKWGKVFKKNSTRSEKQQYPAFYSFGICQQQQKQKKLHLFTIFFSLFTTAAEEKKNNFQLFHSLSKKQPPDFYSFSEKQPPVFHSFFRKTSSFSLFFQKKTTSSFLLFFRFSIFF